MTLYYNIDSYEIKDLPDDLVNGWIENNNPKLDNWILLPSQPTSNHIWTNGSWILISPEIPQTVSARQVRIWLIQHGISLSQVDTAINTIEDPVVRDITKVEWEYAPYIERSHPMLIPLGAALGLSNEQIDQAFVEASNI